MPKAKKLTEASVKRFRVAPPAERVDYPDQLAPGLFLRVNDRGRKSWMVRFRVKGKQGKMALGLWPALALPDAREMARNARGEAAAGRDPRVARPTEHETFGELAETYIAKGCPKRRRKGKLVRAHETASLIRRDILPLLGQVSLSAFNRRDLTHLLDHLEKNGATSAPAKADKAVKRILSWAVERGEIERSPVIGMEKAGEYVPRTRVLDASEIAILWSAWDHIGYPFGPLQKLLLLTGQRLREVAGMTWAEFGDDGATWTIPTSRAKNNKQHTLPLPALARQILAEVPRFAGAYVFTTTSGRRPVSGFSKAKLRTDAAAKELAGGPLEPWRVHDLRRTCRTGLARLDVRQEVAERVLNHKVDALVGTYDAHSYLPQIGNALELWAQEVMRIIAPEPPENVIRLRRSSATA